MWEDRFKNDEERLRWYEKRYDEIDEELKDPDLFPIQREILENEQGEILDNLRRFRGHPAYYTND